MDFRRMLFILVVLMLSGPIMSQAAQISGSVYTKEGGKIPADLGPISIKAFKGDENHGTHWLGEADVSLENGTYHITNLPPGLYFLIAKINIHYPQQCWTLPESAIDDLSFCSSATPILVVADEIVTGKDFYLDIGNSTISGTVYMSDGTSPANQGQIKAYPVVHDGSCDLSHSARSFDINADGTYSIDHLPAGEYLLSAEAYNKTITQVEQGDNYLKVWWATPGSVLDCENATPISVAEGEIVTSKNLVLQAGASISGRVFETDGVTPITDLLQSIMVIKNTDPCSQQHLVAETTPFSDGTYIIPQIPTGSYYLMVSPFNWSGDGLPNYGGGYWSPSGTVSDCSAAVQITVANNEQVLDKNFQLGPGAKIAGSVLESDGQPPTLPIDVVVSLYNRNPCLYPDRLSYVDLYYTNGKFEFDRLAAGSYYLLASKVNQAGQWWANDNPVSHCSNATPINVSAGQSLTNRDFIFQEGTQISGKVLGSDGITPLTGSEIGVLVYTGDPCTHQNLQTASGGAMVDKETGTYTLAGITPGTYYFRAWNHLNIEYHDEWLSLSGSSTVCSDADPIVVTSTTVLDNINFQLSYRFAKPGDMNQDSVIGLYDAVVALQALVGMKIHAASPAGDVNEDHKIGVPEVIYILNKVVQ